MDTLQTILPQLIGLTKLSLPATTSIAYKTTTEDFAAAFRGIPNLKKLVLPRSTRVYYRDGDGAISLYNRDEIFSALSGFKQLESLDLHVPHTDLLDWLWELASKNLSTLKELDLQLPELALPALLLGVGHFPSLRSLKLRFPAFYGKDESLGVGELKNSPTSITRCTDLEELRLPETSQSFSPICAEIFSNCPNINNLNLCYSHALLPNLSRLHVLKKLSLRLSYRDTPSGLQELLQSFAQSVLTHLKIRLNTHFTQDCADAISQISTLRSLTMSSFERLQEPIIEFYHPEATEVDLSGLSLYGMKTNFPKSQQIALPDASQFQHFESMVAYHFPHIKNGAWLKGDLGCVVVDLTGCATVQDLHEKLVCLAKSKRLSSDEDSWTIDSNSLESYGLDKKIEEAGIKHGTIIYFDAPERRDY